MFRDIYKSANDDIKPDSALLARTLSSMEERKKHPPLTFKMVCTCALALLVTSGSIFGYVRYMDYSNPDALPKVARINTNSETENTSQLQKSELSDGSAIESGSQVINEEENTHSKTSSPSKDLQTDGLSNVQGTFKTSDISEAKSSDTDQTVTAYRESTAQNGENSTEESLLTDETAGEPALSGGGSSGGNNHSQTISYSAYCQYIGFDIFKKLSLPYNMTVNVWSEATFDTGNDEITFSYIGEGKSAYITPTKNTDKIYNLIKDCPEREKNYVIVYEKDYSFAYIIKGDVGYTVNCYGFSKSEFTQLTDSILTDN